MKKELPRSGSMPLNSHRSTMNLTKKINPSSLTDFEFRLLYFNAVIASNPRKRIPKRRISVLARPRNYRRSDCQVERLLVLAQKQTAAKRVEDSQHSALNSQLPELAKLTLRKLLGLDALMANLRVRLSIAFPGVEESHAIPIHAAPNGTKAHHRPHFYNGAEKCRSVPASAERWLSVQMGAEFNPKPETK
ncbi:MAG TPA: hypothetical protein VMZ27_17495 [Candidatus Saccharimonadales bacterium]|nr:hypothetical protein [Candidatus Saccharimonadales bacterium]